MTVPGELSVPPQFCPIWGTAALVRPAPGLMHPMQYVESPRAGGVYIIEAPAATRIKAATPPGSEQTKAKLTTMLVDQRRQGTVEPLVTIDDVLGAEARSLLPPYERADRLLADLVARPDKVGEAIPTLFNDVHALAVSESTDYSEVQYLLTYMKESKWISVVHNESIRITVEGYARVQTQKTNADSSQAFIAMWINDETDNLYNLCIRNAVEAAGYKPYRVDKDINEQVDSGTLDAIIIGQIRRSRFLIADFTHGSDGIRGSVYFEAGFAYGLGIPVIFSCKKDQLDKLQFDVRQYPYIAWETHDELREGLEQRILKWIGQGPIQRG